jgi:hypothetical protein
VCALLISWLPCLLWSCDRRLNSINAADSC